MRKTLIAGNWKMYKTSHEALLIVKALLEGPKADAETEVLICPPFPALAPVGMLLKNSWIRLGAQNLYWEKEGAFTGEVSAPLLKEVGCSHVIIGHSERRTYFGETDETVNKKLLAALSSGLIPIVCVGEKLEERENNQTFQVIKQQIVQGLQHLDQEQAGQLVIAYEPVWAIGTGRTASPEQAETIHAFIRNQLASLFGESVANTIRILYGGSVKPENIQALMEQKDIDGALVGGASLNSESFLKIIHPQHSIPTRRR